VDRGRIALPTEALARIARATGLASSSGSSLSIHSPHPPRGTEAPRGRLPTAGAIRFAASARAPDRGPHRRARSTELGPPGRSILARRRRRRESGLAGVGRPNRLAFGSSAEAARRNGERQSSWGTSPLLRHGPAPAGSCHSRGVLRVGNRPRSPPRPLARGRARSRRGDVGRRPPVAPPAPAARPRAGSPGDPRRGSGSGSRAVRADLWQRVAGGAETARRGPAPFFRSRVRSPRPVGSGVCRVGNPDEPSGSQVRRFGTRRDSDAGD